MPMNDRCRLLAGLLLLAGSPFLHAHGLDVLAQRSGERLTGIALYSDRTPAAGIFVEALDADGRSSSLAEGKTDTAGRFELQVPAVSRIRVVAEGEEGHRATALASDVPAAGANHETLLLLREDIGRLEQRLWWRDVLGGLGYLLGIFGLWALWRSRRGSAEGRR